MTKKQFTELFFESIEECAQIADESLGRHVPREFRLRIYGAGRSGDEVSLSDALEIFYINERLFYKIIDLSVVKVEPLSTVVFARISDHIPGTFESTWSPTGSGPFRKLIADEILVDVTPAD